MYDEKIKYFDEDGWRRYFENDLAKLYISVEGFLNVRNGVKAKLGGKTIDSLLNEADFYEKILFGGFQGKEDEPFVKNGLAKFYRDGLGIEARDISDIIIPRMKEGSDIKEASTGILCDIKDSDLVLRLTDLSSKLRIIFKMLRDIIEAPP